MTQIMNLMPTYYGGKITCPLALHSLGSHAFFQCVYLLGMIYVILRSYHEITVVLLPFPPCGQLVLPQNAQVETGLYWTRPGSRHTSYTVHGSAFDPPIQDDTNVHKVLHVWA